MLLLLLLWLAVNELLAFAYLFSHVDKKSEDTKECA